MMPFNTLQVIYGGWGGWGGRGDWSGWVGWGFKDQNVPTRTRITRTTRTQPFTDNWTSEKVTPIWKKKNSTLR